MTATTGFRVLGARSGGEMALAMQRLQLTGRLLPVGARLMVRHVFQSQEKKPLEVVYSFLLPRDAALCRFRITGEGFSARSELKPVEEAVQAYEAGMEAGHLSTLARQYGDGIVNLSLGNLRPGETVSVSLEVLAGVELRDDGLRFRFPFTLAPGYHSAARTVEAEPGTGEIELPEEEFGDVILPRYQKDARGLHEVGFELAIAMAQGVAEIGSPSHPVRVAREDERRARVRLAGSHDVPDRDLVLDVQTVDSAAGAIAGRDREGKGRLAVVMPSESFGERPQVPRRVVLVVDRSGSMNGEPMAQALRAIRACLGALAEEDQFGLIAFDDKVEIFRARLAPGTMAERDAAGKFLANVDARGGTELGRALERAARMLATEGGDILVMTDGQVFGTEKIVESARAAGMRIHCLGIGSASQDRFLALLARQTGGVSRFLTARERVDVAAVDLFASVGRPLASEIAVKGATVLTELPASVFAGTPLVFFGESEGGRDGAVRVEWRGGHREMGLQIGENAVGETLRLLTGARLIAEATADSRIEELSRRYGLASRRMALVAVVERAGDRAGDLPKTVVVPVGMPQDTDFAACFSDVFGDAFRAPKSLLDTSTRFSMLFKARAATAAPPRSAPPARPPDGDDLLLELAARIMPDGGMPGATESERIEETVKALTRFLEEGHTLKRGAFRSHVERLVRYLEKLQRPELQEVLQAARAGRALPGKGSRGSMA